MANLKDTDKLIVSRGNDSYSYTYTDLKTSLEEDGIGSTYASTTPPASPTVGDLWLDTNECPPELKVWTDCSGTAQWEGISSGGDDVTTPIIDTVTLTEDSTGGSRFSGQSFTADVTMFSEGAPTSQKEYSYKVTSDYTGTVDTDPQSSATSTSITFSGSTNLNLLEKEDVISIAPPADLTAPALASVSYSSNGTGGTEGDGFISMTHTNISAFFTRENRIECVFNTNTNNQTVLVRGDGTQYDNQVSTSGTSYNGFKVLTAGNQTLELSFPTSYALPTGQSILIGSSGKVLGPYYSENGVSWAQTPRIYSSDEVNAYGYAVSGNRMWYWRTSELAYSTNKGNNWSGPVSNPLYPDYAYDIYCAIDYGPHIILYGSGPSNSGQTSWKITNKNSNLTSLSEYQAIATPFNREGPGAFSAYRHAGCDGGFFCTAEPYPQSNVVYTTDAGLTWQAPSTSGLTETTSREDSLIYDENTGWYYYIQQSADYSLLFQSRDPQSTWIACGYLKPGSGSGGGTSYRYLPQNNRLLGFYKNSSFESQYRDMNFPPGTVEFTATFKDNTEAQLWFDRPEVGPGLYITYTYGGVVSTAMITEIDETNKTMTCIQGFYGTKTTTINKLKFTPGNTDVITISPVQQGFGITSISGSTVTGTHLRLSNGGNLPLSSFNGSVYSSMSQELINAYRYLAIDPNGNVTGYLNGPVPKFTYLLTDTINFPTNAPTGNSWDVELPAGATLTVGVAADNTAGGGARNPALGTFDASVTPGATKSSTQADAVTGVLNFKTFDYRSEVYMSDLIARGNDIRLSLTAEGYSTAEINDVLADETPVAIDGYYPLYTSEASSNAAGNGSSHTHTANGVTYYMPDGGVTIYHGNYSG